jgi:hypothetical protein
MSRRRRLKQHVEEALIRLDVEPLAGGGYLATSPDVPGLVAEGRTLAETAEIGRMWRSSSSSPVSSMATPCLPRFAGGERRSR